jgi:hypothetical protein
MPATNQFTSVTLPVICMDMKLVSYIESVWEQGAEENIWT